MLLLAIAYIGFVGLGVPDGLLGVAWPSMRGTFDLRLDALAPLLVAAAIGYLASSAGTGALVARLGLGGLLALSSAATAIALVAFGLAPAWWIVVAAAFVLGAGGGAIDAGLNAHAATRHSPRVVSWLHASYGVGATLGPLVMTAVLAAGMVWRVGYLIIAIAQVALAFAFTGTRARWPVVAADVRAARPATARATLALPVARLTMLTFFVYTGIEAGAGQWAFTVFTEGRGLPAVPSGLWVAVYFGAFTVGRVLFGVVARPERSNGILRGCIGVVIGATAVIALSTPPPVGYVALAVTGFALAPVFPFLIAATPSRLGETHTTNAVGFQVSAAVLGATLLPSGMGVLAQRFGVEAVPVAWLVSALLLFVLHELLVRARGAAPELAV